MLFRRIALTLFAAAAVAPFVWGDGNKNPFSQWEELKEHTEPVETDVEAVQTKKAAPAATTPKAAPVAKAIDTDAAAFFSANSPAETTVKPAAAQTPPAVKRERLRVAVAATGETTQAAANDPFAASGEPVATTPSNPFAVSAATEQVAKSPKTVSVAAFADSEHVGGVQQTGADFFEELSGEGSSTPFAEAAEFAATAKPKSNGVPVVAVSATKADPVFEEPTQAPVVEQTAFDGTAFTPSADTAAPAVTLPSSLQGPQTPSVTLRWVHHDEYSVGQECRCDLVVENSGRSVVRNVMAEAVLPQGLQVIDAQPAPTAAGTSARWAFAELQPGQTEKISLVVVPRQEGDVQMNAFVQLTGATSSNVAVTKPMLAIKVEGSSTVEVGQQAGYTVHITNPGTGKAKNVVIQAAVPQGLEHRQGSLLTIEIGTLNPGEVRQARLNLTAVKGGEQKMAVRVIADGDLSDQTIQRVTVAEPRLNIGLRGPDSRKTGQLSDYELVVVNEGNVDSSNVRAKYKVPAGFEFVQADAGGKFNTDDRTIEWFVGTLEPNRSRQFKVTLRPTKSGESLHQVGVLSEHGKMTVAEHSTAVAGKAELTLTVATTQKQVSPGGEAVFNIHVENNGSSAAEGVGLSCELPPALEILEITGPSEFIADNGAVIFRSMPSLDAGKSATFAIRVRCSRAGNHRVRARVASQSIGEALIGEETTTGLNK